MNTAKLVVLTGLPGSGKSVVAERLMRDHGFVRLSTDLQRESFYGLNYGDLKKDPMGETKEGLIWDLIRNVKIDYLLNNISVVIDSTAPAYNFRNELMRIPYQKEFFGIKAYLVFLNSERRILEKRIKLRGDDPAVLEFFDNFWEEPNIFGYNNNLITINNNPNEDLPSLYRALEKILQD